MSPASVSGVRSFAVVEGVEIKIKQMKMCFVQENTGGGENAEFPFYQMRIRSVIKSIWCACCAAPLLSPGGGRRVLLPAVLIVVE